MPDYFRWILTELKKNRISLVLLLSLIETICLFIYIIIINVGKYKSTVLIVNVVVLWILGLFILIILIANLNHGDTSRRALSIISKSLELIHKYSGYFIFTIVSSLWLAALLTPQNVFETIIHFVWLFRLLIGFGLILSIQFCLFLFLFRGKKIGEGAVM